MMPVKEIEQVTLEHLGRGDHWLEPRAHCTGIPLLEEAQSCPCVGTLPKMAKPLFECPGSTDFKNAIEQVAQPGTALAVEVFRREEKKEITALQGLFSFPRSLRCSVRRTLSTASLSARNMEAVMNNFCLRHLGFGCRLESRAHVHDDGFDVLTLLERYALKEPSALARSRPSVTSSTREPFGSLKTET